MRTLSLSRPASVTLDAHGNGTASLGPSAARETWLPTVASVSVSTNAAEAACRIYAGPLPTQAYYVDGTLSGSTGDSTANIAGQAIEPGQYVWAVWSGGDPGAVATLSVSGTRQVP